MQKVIVALTSYPKRIELVDKVIQSLWRQSMPADEILLYLSDTEFPDREHGLPQILRDMSGINGFRIVWVKENLKSHKKYFYVLQNYPDDIVITIDDDVVYADTMIHDLICSYRKYPKAISARTVRIMVKNEDGVAKYNDWDNSPVHFADTPRMDLCAIGYGGVLYPPACTTALWFRKEDIRALAWNQDDLWLKYNEIIGHYPVVYAIPEEADCLIDEADATALCRENMYDGGNDVSVKKLSLWLENTYADIYHQWLSSLLRKEEYFLLKRKFYMKMFIKSMDALGNTPIYLFGAGKRARQILQTMEDADLLNRLQGILVSDKDKNPDNLRGIQVEEISGIDSNLEFAVICAVGEQYQYQVSDILKNYRCKYLHFNLV